MCKIDTTACVTTKAARNRRKCRLILDRIYNNLRQSKNTTKTEKAQLGKLVADKAQSIPIFNTNSGILRD